MTKVAKRANELLPLIEEAIKNIELWLNLAKEAEADDIAILDIVHLLNLATQHLARLGAILQLSSSEQIAQEKLLTPVLDDMQAFVKDLHALGTLAGL